MYKKLNFKNNNYIFVRNIFFRTCVFFTGAYFIFHFINGNISLNPLENKKDLVEQNLNILDSKEKELVFKELLVSKITNVQNNLDLLDELTRFKLGYSSKDEILISLE